MSYSIYEEYRLIERTEGDINRAWKGAHLLLFFLAFVFGSFCTFCFHMLMYLFDEKCVLFPKLLSLTSQRHNVIYEFIPTSGDLSNLPVDFVSTQWVDKSTCELPTYVPLVSAIFGLVWTTMFLMCSTGSRTLTGLQRPWRVLPPVFVFSMLMSILCIYSSIITHNGLQELCIKLGEITGSSTCTYTVNVATLTYERRIRGVYQATRLTILTAWLHTACWLCSAFLTVARVLLVVDFQLVRIHVCLRGDVEKLMEQNETEIRSFMPDYAKSRDKIIHPLNRNNKSDAVPLTELLKTSPPLYDSRNISEESLLPEVRKRVDRFKAYSKVSDSQRFIVNIVHDMIDDLTLPGEPQEVTVFKEHDSPKKKDAAVKPNLTASVIGELLHKFGQNIQVVTIRKELLEVLDNFDDNEYVADKVILELYETLDKILNQRDEISDANIDMEDTPSETFEMQKLYATSDEKQLDEQREFSSVMLLPEMDRRKKKSSLRQASTQTEQQSREQRTPKHVIISESYVETDQVDDDTQTSKKEKEKQD